MFDHSHLIQQKSGTYERTCMTSLLDVYISVSTLDLLGPGQQEMIIPKELSSA